MNMDKIKKLLQKTVLSYTPLFIQYKYKMSIKTKKLEQCRTHYYYYYYYNVFENLQESFGQEKNNLNSIYFITFNDIKINFILK